MSSYNLTTIPLAIKHEDQSFEWYTFLAIIYTVVRNKPDSINRAIVSCCESYLKKKILCNLRAMY